MNRNEPSPSRTLQPPEWALLALAYCEPSGLHPAQPLRQLAQAYWVELGGTIVLNMVNDIAPMIHHWPPLSIRALEPAVSPRNEAEQAFSSLVVWVAFAVASWRPLGLDPLTP